MTIKTFVFSPFQENTYLVHTEDKRAMIIDPGCLQPAEEAKLKGYVEDNGLTVEHLVNTHLHLDHVFGNAFVEETWKLGSQAHAGDDFWLKGLEAQCRMFGLTIRKTPAPVAKWLVEGDRIALGQDIFDVIHVPGHSPGSIVLYQASAGCLFAGDVLFDGSIGRTDLQGGDYGQLIRGIREKLFTLPEETVVYSGHGPSTTIGKEKSYNPFL